MKLDFALSLHKINVENSYSHIFQIVYHNYWCCLYFFWLLTHWYLKLKFDWDTFWKKSQIAAIVMFILQIWKIHMSDLWIQRKICVVDQSERIHEHSFNLEFSRILLLKDFMHDAKLGSPSEPLEHVGKGGHSKFKWNFRGHF